MLEWARRVLRIKSDEQIRREVEEEPVVRQARHAFDKARPVLGDRVARELEALERRHR